MILKFEGNKIENIEEFGLSLNNFHKLEKLEMHFDNN